MREALASLAAMRNRDFRLFFWAQAISVFGDRMVAVALAFAVIELGGSASEVGLVMAATFAPLVAFLLVGGVLADRMERRRLAMLADVVRVASQAAIAALLIGGWAEIWMLALLSAVTGAATGLCNPALSSIVPQLVSDDELGSANGLKATAASAGEIGGPIVAGALVALAGAGPALAVDAATFGASALLISRIAVRGRPERERSGFARDLRDGWRAFVANTWVWTFVAAIAISNTVWAAWSTLGPIVADRELGGAATWGTALGVLGAGALMGGLIATRIRPRRPMVFLAIVEIGIAVPLALLALGAAVVPLAAGAFVAGAAIMLSNSIWEATLQRFIPSRSLGRVSAYDWFGSMAFMPLGFVIWGPVSEVIGVGATLWITVGVLVAVAVVLLAIPSIRTLVDEGGRHPNTAGRGLASGGGAVGAPAERGP